MAQLCRERIARLGGAQQISAWYGGKDKDPYSFFASNARTVAAYKAWIGMIVSRVNAINAQRYADDPTIFAWELMNEPSDGWAPAADAAAPVRTMASTIPHRTEVSP